ncbi:MAG: NAD-dependent epimerase/dehydratase family protein [Kineosporiaceae bacterium]
MTRPVVVTGAAGYLGNVLCRELLGSGYAVRALVHSAHDRRSLDGLPVEIVEGDVRRPADLDALLGGLGPAAAVLHCAGIVSIAWDVTEEVRQVNVGGTANVIDACRRHGIRRLVYTSSVHAIPAGAHGAPIREAARFHPDSVVGGYAKTKAAATQLVLDADGPALSTVVVHPSGLVGPGDFGQGPVTALVRDLVTGRLPAYVDGGYDFVDVRDVGAGMIAALERGRSGQCYILSGRYLSIEEIVRVTCAAAGRRPVRRVVPSRVAALVAPGLERVYGWLGRPALVTRYSLHTLAAPARFSQVKARSELGFAPRDPADSLRDTVAWLSEIGVGRKRPGAGC